MFQPVETAKSMPCVQTTAPILPRDTSDHSMDSYKSCIAYHDLEVLGAERPSVKLLIEKHKSFQEKLITIKTMDSDVKKKSIVVAGETLKKSYKYCVQHVAGDVKSTEDIEDYVRSLSYTVLSRFYLTNGIIFVSFFFLQNYATTI